jgi:hypothetical protein
MDNKHRYPSLVGPAILIGIGIILLLDNLGYLTWNIWELLRLWPLLLIMWGLEILLQGRLLGRIVTALFILIAMLGSFWFINSGTGAQPTTMIEHLRNDASSFVVNLEPSVGTVTLQAYSDSANLVGGEVTVPRGITVIEDFTGGNRARLRVTTRPEARNWWPGNSETWDFKLSRDILLDLDINQGIGDIQLDLEELKLNKVNVDFGISSLKIHIPERGNYDLSIDGGIGGIILEIPQDMAVHITGDTGIVGKTFPGDYQRIGDVWTSPNYDDSEYSANIYLSLGIGTITVRRIP